MDKIINYLGDKIDPQVFRRDMYYLNLLVFKLYKIYSNQKLSYNAKLTKILNLRDPDNNRFLIKSQAKYILDNYAKDIYILYTKLYSLRENAVLNKQNNLMFGGTIQSKIKNNFNSIYNYLDDPETEQKTKLLFNWIFFPIWSLENSATIGPFIEIPLDILTIVLDNLDILMEAFAPIVPIILDTVVDVGQAIPAYGTAVSAIAIPLNFLEGPMEEFIANFTDIIGMFINISRKDWDMAYMSALAAIPVFADIMDAVITNAYITNKWLLKVNNKLSDIDSIIDRIDQTINNYEPIILELLENPNLLLHPTKLIKNIVIPNKNAFGLKNVSNEQLNLILNKLGESGSIVNKIGKNREIYLKNPKKFYKEIIEPALNAVPKNQEILKLANIIFKNINDLLI
uniref:Uncharacterized protein n=1 Tax=viral metagenome TaxID=1070528 RepID=A0A6C0EKL4_9ZZZZ